MNGKPPWDLHGQAAIWDQMALEWNEIGNEESRLRLPKPPGMRPARQVCQSFQRAVRLALKLDTELRRLDALIMAIERGKEAA